MKKYLALFLLLASMAVAPAAMAGQALDGHAQIMYDAIRWNLNLPKQSSLVRAEEYLFKLTKEITLHALLMEVTTSPELEMQYGMGGRIVVADLDSGMIIDYRNFDGNVSWPQEGEAYVKEDALHLLYNGYWAWLEGYNESIMSMHEFITPVDAQEIEAVNAELTKAFVR